MSFPRPTWTPEQDARLRELDAEGTAYAEIARQFGVTKNTIVGRAYRLRLPGRKRPRRPRRAPLELVPTGAGTCRFIEGDPRHAKHGTDIWCGEPVAAIGEPYCPGHRSLCWTGKPVPPKRAALAVRESDGRQFR